MGSFAPSHTLGPEWVASGLVPTLVQQTVARVEGSQAAGRHPQEPRKGCGSQEDLWLRTPYFYPCPIKDVK